MQPSGKSDCREVKGGRLCLSPSINLQDFCTPKCTHYPWTPNWNRDTVINENGGEKRGDTLPVRFRCRILYVLRAIRGRRIGKWPPRHPSARARAESRPRPSPCPYTEAPRKSMRRLNNALCRKRRNATVNARKAFESLFTVSRLVNDRKERYHRYPRAIGKKSANEVSRVASQYCIHREDVEMQATELEISIQRSGKCVHRLYRMVNFSQLYLCTLSQQFFHLSCSWDLTSFQLKMESWGATVCREQCSRKKEGDY